MSQVIHSYLKLEKALFSFLTNVEFSLLLSLSLPAKVGQTLNPSRELAEGMVFVQGILFAAYPSPPSTLVLPTWLLTRESCLCGMYSAATKPSVSGWGWPTGAPAGDQREAGEGGQGVHCYDSSLQGHHSGRHLPHVSLLPGSCNLSFSHAIRSDGGNSSTAWLPGTCPHLIRNTETLL